MPNKTVAAQKQAQKQQVVDETQSYNLMKNLLHSAISSISYTRLLFDASCFRKRSMGDTRFFQLLPETNESRKLLEWLDTGVADALRRKFLDEMVFAIFAEDDSRLESYTFKISYADDLAGAGVLMTKKSTKEQKFIKADESERDVVKKATAAMIRNLVSITGTMTPLPSQHYFSVRLTYRPHTPQAYEPKFFKAASDNEKAMFPAPSQASGLQVGAVNTQHHSMTVAITASRDRIGTVEQDQENSQYYNDQDDDEDIELRTSLEVNEEKMRPSGLQALAPALQTLSLADSQSQGGDDEMGPPPTVPEEKVSHERFAQLKRDIMSSRLFTIKEITSHFQVSRSLAKGLLTALEGQGVIEKRGACTRYFPVEVELQAQDAAFVSQATDPAFELSVNSMERLEREYHQIKNEALKRRRPPSEDHLVKKFGNSAKFILKRLTEDHIIERKGGRYKFNSTSGGHELQPSLSQVSTAGHNERALKKRKTSVPTEKIKNGR